MPSSARRRRDGPLGALGGALLFGVGYLALAELGRLLTLTRDPLVPFWPASGLAVGVLLAQARLGRWPLLLAAAAAASLASDLLLHDRAVPLALGLAVGNLAEASACAALLSRRGLPFRLDSTRALMAFSGAAALGAALGAAVGTGTLAVAEGRAAWAALPQWWMADLLGIVVAAPAALSLLVPGEIDRRVAVQRDLEAVALAICIAVVGAWLFWIGTALPLLWAMLPLLLWAALRFGTPGAAFAVAGFAAIAVAGTAGGHGPFVALEPTARVMLVQALLAVYVANTLLVAALYRRQREVRRALRDTLDQRTALLQAISDHSQDIVFARDADGRLRFANPAIERYFGRPVQDLIGRSIDEIVPDPAAAREIAEADRRIMRSGRAETVEHELRFPDGTRLTLLSSKVPMRDVGGRVTGVVGIAHDLSERKRAEQALAERERRMRLALQAARMVAYEWDLATDEVRRSGQIEAVFGAAPDEHDRGAHVFERLSPDDGARLRQAIAGLAPDRDTFTLAYELRRPDGRRSVIEETAQARFDAGGRMVSLVGMSVDVTEREAALEALRTANARKDEFLAMLAHELRNPLAPIRNGVRYLRATTVAGAPSAHGATITMIERQVDHLVRLVDDLLDMSRITQGRVALRRERVVLQAVLATAIEAARPLIDSLGHRLIVDLPEAPLALDADPTRLAQIAGNLLNNAAKYSPPGRRIWLRAHADGEAIELRVRDEGMGIAPELLPEIFELFIQDERSLDRSHGGLGIGLALVRRLVEMHGGRVAASSPGPGQGAEFVVRLPGAARA